MITKEQIAEAAEQYAEQENSAWTNDYNGFEAGANFVLQKLQQCNVSGRSELLIDFIRWFRQHPEYEQVTETPLAELYEKSINSH